MLARCLNPKKEGFANYGGRGIIVCERWQESFADFLADMGECPPDLFIDRVDNDKGYFKSNCRWTDRTTNNRNQRKSIRVDGVPLAQIAEEVKVSYRRLKYQAVTKKLPLDLAIANAKQLEIGIKA